MEYTGKKKGNKELGITAVRIESRQTEEKCGIQQNVELEKRRVHILRLC